MIIDQYLKLVFILRQPQWTQDESICARLVGSELLFHENNDFSMDYKNVFVFIFFLFENGRVSLGKYAHKLVIPKMADFSLSLSHKPYHVAAYVPVGKVTTKYLIFFISSQKS